MLSDEEDKLLSHALSFLGDNFPHYAISVLSAEDGELHYDYSNWRIGRMLMKDSIEDMSGEIGMGQDWSWSDEGEGESEYE